MFVNEKSTKKAFGKKLKAARMRRKPTVEQVAKRVNEMCDSDTVAVKPFMGGNLDRQVLLPLWLV